MINLKTLARRNVVLLAMSLVLTVETTEIAASGPAGSSVSPDLAIAAALDQVLLFFPGEWRYVSQTLMPDLDGQPTAYAVVLRRATTQVRTPDELTERIRRAREARIAAEAEVANIERDSSLSASDKKERSAEIRRRANDALREARGEDEYVTLTVAARDTWPLVLCADRGLPQLLTRSGEMAEMAQAFSGSEDWRISRFFYVSPFEMVFEFAHPGKIPDMGAPAGVSETLLISTVTKKHIRGEDFRRVVQSQVAVGSEPRSFDSEEATWLEANRRVWNQLQSRQPKEEAVPGGERRAIQKSAVSADEGTAEKSKAPLFDNDWPKQTQTTGNRNGTTEESLSPPIREAGGKEIRQGSSSVPNNAAPEGRQKQPLSADKGRVENVRQEMVPPSLAVPSTDEVEVRP